MGVNKVGTAIICGAIFLGAVTACGNAGSDQPRVDGKALFEKHCSVCHPDGGNIINAKKTLKSADLKASGITSASDIVEKMRNPGPGMSKFDEKTIPDNEAKAIAEYVLKTF